MRSKRFLSTVVATALVATTMAMPVMAADGGTVDVDVTTKSAVIRVEVPTALEIAVDQFESVDGGVQIYSTPFTMKNKSGVAVKVGVDSTATVTGAKLVSSVDAVKASTDTAGEAWLAVAAQTEADKYGVEKIGDLTEASANVATFDATGKNATQTFYLAKGDGNVEYKMLAPAADGEVGDVSYAQFYKLTDKTAATNDQDKLNALLQSEDVYVGTAAAADGTALALVKKGEAHTHDSGEYYYTAADTATAANAVESAEKYVYAGTATVGGQAAFRYIGKLSEKKATAWSKTDISKVSIAYTLDGVTASAYEEAAKDCTYGLYTTPSVPSITTTNYTVDPESNTEIAVNLGAASKGAKGVKSVTWEGEELINSDNDAKYENGKVIIDASVGNYFNQQGLLPATLTITFDMNDANAEAVSVDVTLKK